MSERKRAPRCKWCEQGVKLTDGEHWVVKSIFPAKISIQKCKVEASRRALADKATPRETEERG